MVEFTNSYLEANEKGPSNKPQKYYAILTAEVSLRNEKH